MREERRYEMASQKQIDDSLRAVWTATFKQFVDNNIDADVCQTAAGTFMFPTVDEAGEDRWVKVSIIIPKDACEENGNTPSEARYLLKICRFLTETSKVPQLLAGAEGPVNSGSCPVL